MPVQQSNGSNENECMNGIRSRNMTENIQCGGVPFVNSAPHLAISTTLNNNERYKKVDCITSPSNFGAAVCAYIV